MFSVQEWKTGAGQYVLIGLVTAVCALPVLIPQNLYGTLFSPEFVTYMLADLNILDNILLPAVQANRGRRGKRRADLVGEARKLMRRLSVSDIETRGITQVSGGQLQRACICRSMINVPEILFADEPTGSVKLIQHYPKEIPVILFSLSMRISEITDRHSVRFSSRVSDS